MAKKDHPSCLGLAPRAKTEEFTWEIPRQWHDHYDIAYNNNSLSILCLVVYALIGTT